MRQAIKVKHDIYSKVAERVGIDTDLNQDLA